MCYLLKMRDCQAIFLFGLLLGKWESSFGGYLLQSSLVPKTNHHKSWSLVEDQKRFPHASVGFSGTPKDMGPKEGPILFPNPTAMFDSLKIWVP